MIDIWNNPNQEQPGGLCYRFLPQLANLTIGYKGAEKYKFLWMKHVKYNNQLVLIRSDKVASLDRPIIHNNEEITLRQWLSRDKCNRGYSIIKGMRAAPFWDENFGIDTIFICLKKDNAVATSYITSMVPRAHQIFGDKVKAWFHTRAVEDTMDIEFNDKGEILSSPDENMLDNLLNEDNGVKLVLPDNFALQNDINETDDDDNFDGRSAMSFGSEINLDESGNNAAFIRRIDTNSLDGTGTTSDLTEQSGSQLCAHLLEELKEVREMNARLESQLKAGTSRGWWITIHIP